MVGRLAGSGNAPTVLDGRSLPKLERMSDSRWDVGRVVSLLHLNPESLPVTIADGWQGASNSNLSFLP